MTNIAIKKSFNYRQAQFLTSAAKPDGCPEDIGCEVAFAGRSNAGKSSAINTLTDNKKMAKTSKTPGRTQLINFFTVAENRRIVDLPGYGYAKVPLEVKHRWQRHLESYLNQRQSLRGLILLMDVRHPLLEFDQMMLSWAQHNEMAVHILLTKSDKLKKGAANNALLSVETAIANSSNSVSVQLFSALKKTGLTTLTNVLNDWLSQPGVIAPETETTSD